MVLEKVASSNLPWASVCPGDAQVTTLPSVVVIPSAIGILLWLKSSLSDPSLSLH